MDEYTPLKGDNPDYAFQNRFPLFRRRSRHYQFCIGALCFTLAIIILVIIVSLSIKVENDIQSSILHAKEQLSLRDDVENQMPVLQSSSPSFRHQMSTRTYHKADQIGRAGFATDHASKWLAKKRNHNPKEPFAPICSSALDDWCFKKTKPKCKQTKYRTIDGSCNSLSFPNEWGTAFSTFTRVVPPEYEDGIGEPRGGLKNSYLPPASVVSRLVHRPSYKNDPNFTVMLAVWGQFIDHDITATALSRGQNGQAISCCGQKILHPECFPVIEKLEDGSEKCMDFVRSAPAATCCFGPREQLNQVTPFLDGSVIYGSDAQLSSELRTFQNGTLKMLTSGTVGKYLLPVSTNPNDGCNRADQSEKGRYCFVSGDGRANENLFLTTMHLIWARQHNKVAEQLFEVNPEWSDEKIYQEARRIVGAQIQHITYAEFLPIVLGKSQRQSEEYFDGYNASTPPLIINSFASSAFRFAHTLIPGMYRKFNSNNSTYEYFKLHEMLFDPFRLYNNELDEILHEAMDNNIEMSDQYFTDELKSHLFERKNGKNKPGLDLIALNIQRGRDHGLPGYVKFRKWCNLSVPEQFDDMSGYIDQESIDIMKKLYKKLEDIDVYTGALSERQLSNSLVGPTISCILTKQFNILRTSDRFWYETPEHPQAFTPDQLQEIKSTTLASVICHNSDSMQYLPKFVMKASFEDDIVSCDDIPGPNMTFWKDA